VSPGVGKKDASGGECCCGHFTQHEIEELVTGRIPRAKMVMRRNGVEAPEAWPEPGTFRGKLGIPVEARGVLFLGRLNVKKSPALLLRAFAQVKKRLEGVPLRLVFAGPDESGVKAQLERLAAQLDSKREGQLPGPVFGQDKWAATGTRMFSCSPRNGRIPETP